MPVERSDSPKTSLLRMQLAATQAPEEQRKPRAVAGIPAGTAPFNSSRRGGDFRSRKYNQPQHTQQTRVNALLSAR